MIQDSVFVLVASLTLLGAFLAVWLKNIFYNALGLILCLAGIAGLFLYLNSEFLAVMQVIIYIGAISIAIIFAIMLSSPAFRKNEERNAPKVIRSIFIAVLAFGALWRALGTTTWNFATVDGDYSIRALGKVLLSSYALPFEVVSVVLLVAIIGALLLSGKETAK